MEQLERGPDALGSEVLAGLLARPKRLPPKLFYDAAGSALFDRITALPEYYLTRAEAQVLRDHGERIAGLVRPTAAGGGRVVLVEPGCGGSTKAAALLRHWPVATYVGVDISPVALEAGAAALARMVGWVRIVPVVDDYTAPGWTAPALPEGRRVAFFPGSTIGNFDPPDARAFLAMLGEVVGPDGVVVVGADFWKDPDVLRAAYDDAEGVTAEFNRNALRHLVRRYGLAIDADRFRHEIRIDPARHVVEMHLASVGRQRLSLWGQPIRFEDGETIHTECCYKLPLDAFRAMARSAGLASVGTWMDDEERFAVHAFTRLGD